MSRVLCWLGFHRAAFYIDQRWCFAFECERCNRIVDGPLKRRRRHGR